MDHIPLLSLVWLTLLSLVVSSQGFFWIGGDASRKAGVEQQGKMAHSQQYANQYANPAQYSHAQQYAHPQQYANAQQYASPQYTYRLQPEQWTPQYDSSPAAPMTVALPVAVPISASQMQTSSGSMNNVPQPVQLVPCLCPITRDEPPPQQPTNNQQQQQNKPAQNA